MVISTHPGACDAVCAEEWLAQSKSAVITQTKKRQGLRFSCGRETNAFELVIFDTSSFQELPRRLLFSTRGMEDRLKNNRRCPRRTAFLLWFVTSLELAFWTPGCLR